MRIHHIEAFSETILFAIEAQKDISLVELAALLRTKHGVSFVASTVWRFQPIGWARRSAQSLANVFLPLMV
ncbi:MAG: hypothetical protein ACP5RC_07430 [Halothiobacillaceae bacterium]